jgi:hypothetical protein
MKKISLFLFLIISTSFITWTPAWLNSFLTDLVKMLNFTTREVIKMKNQLFIAMMVMASLLFIATGASAQYCLTCGFQGAAGIWSQQENQEMAPATSGEQEGTLEFAPAVPAHREGIEEMSPTGVGGITGLNEAHENSAQFAKDRGVCGYCSVFERGGFP